jgi:hypothetical protein
MVLTIVITLFLAWIAGWTLWTLSKLIHWPQCLAQLWRGLVNLLCVLCWCSVCVVALWCVCVLGGWVNFPFRGQLEDFEEKTIQEIIKGIYYLWQIPQVSFMFIICSALGVVGILAAGRLRRLMFKKHGKSRDFSS